MFERSLAEALWALPQTPEYMGQKNEHGVRFARLRWTDLSSGMFRAKGRQGSL